MLTIRDLKKSVGGRTLFEDAAMKVNYGERVALVGPNGAGKSTLFSIILKTEEPDAGTRRARRVDDDRLPAAGGGGASATRPCWTWPRAARARLPALEKRLHELEKAGDVDSPEYLEAHAKHEALSDPQVEAKAKKMLARPRLSRGGFRRSRRAR